MVNALEMAIQQRKPDAGLLHHSDRGSQYTGKTYRELLAANGMFASMSGKGDCWDNAPTESFFSSLKREQVHHQNYETRNLARTDIFFYIEAFYNRKRRHSTLGYLNPVAFEEIYFNTQSVSSLCLQYWGKIKLCLHPSLVLLFIGFYSVYGIVLSPVMGIFYVPFWGDGRL